MKVKLTGSNNFELQRCALSVSLLLRTVPRYMSNYITLNIDFFFIEGIEV